MKLLNIKSCIWIIILLFLSCQSDVKKEVRDGVLFIKNPKDGLWQDEKDPPISFELEQTFGKENEPIDETFSWIQDVFTDNQNNVYIFVGRENRLVAFNNAGDFLWTKGREGQGPGEFYSTRGAVCDGEKYIYVSNLSGKRIDRFDLNGNYQEGYNLHSLDLDRVSLNGFIQPNILVVTQHETGECGIHIILLELGESLKIRTKIDIIEDIGVEIPRGVGAGPHLIVSGDEIIVSSVQKYEFKYFNIDGELTKKITRDFNKLVRPGVWSSDNTSSIGSYSTLVPPMKILNGYEISSAYWPTNIGDPDKYLILSRNKQAPELKFDHMVDLFNNNGELLYTIYGTGTSIPEIGGLRHVDCEGRLYTTVYEPFPQLRRYRVIIKKN